MRRGAGQGIALLAIVAFLCFSAPVARVGGGPATAFYRLLAPQVTLAAPAADPAGAVMTAVYQKVQPFLTGGFTERIDIVRDDPLFMTTYLPPLRDPTTNLLFNLQATVKVTMPSTWQIQIDDRYRPGSTIDFTSTDGFDIAGTPYLMPAPTGSPSASPSASVSPSASPSASASPSPSASASASPSPSASPTADSTQSFADNRLYPYQPLTLVWPLPLKDIDAHYTMVSSSETLFGADCWVIDRSTGSFTMKLWIDKAKYTIRQIEYNDPVDGQDITGSYPDLIDIPGAFSTYGSLKIYKNHDRELMEATVTAVPVVSTHVQAPRPVGPPLKPPPIIHRNLPKVVVFLTRTLQVIVFLLLIALAYYGGRYLIFLFSRAEFSKDLILVEADDGPLGQTLTELGYPVTSCSMEVLTEERKYLGKKPGATLPRVVVIAPNSFHLIKGYLFLLRAYVEEGGRVMVMTHSPSMIPTMPFTPYFVPNMGEGKNVLLSRPNFWKRLRTEDVEQKTAHLLPREFYIEVNQRRPDLDLVQVYNQATGVRATAVGVVREGKGEYMLCQFTLSDDLARNSKASSPVARLMFLDLMDYLQARPKEPKKGGKPTAAATA